MRTRALLTVAGCVIGVGPAAGEVVTLTAEGSVNLWIDPDYYPPRLSASDYGLGFSDRATIEMVYHLDPIHPSNSRYTTFLIESFRIDLGSASVDAVGGKVWISSVMTPWLFMSAGGISPAQLSSDLPFRVSEIAVSAIGPAVVNLNGAAPTASDADPLVDSGIGWSIFFKGGSLYGQIDTLTITPAPASALAFLGLGVFARRRR